jgi:hypothetical protein
MRYQEDFPTLRKQFDEIGFKKLVEKDILPNVVQALEKDNERKKEWIEEKAGAKFLHKTYEEFAGTIGSQRYQLFKDGKMGYWHFVLQKTEK